jgi:predicted exporter
MAPRHLYLGLCVAGTILPLTQLAPFVREHGLDLRRMAAELFANRISSFFGLDVIVTTLVLWVFVAIEARRSAVCHVWAPIVASLTVGVSLGLPLFLYLREERQP